MRLEDKVGQMLMVGFYGLTAPDYILDWLRQGRVGGIILFARNVESPAQLARLTRRLHEAAKYPLLIGIDQEGGTVARLRKGFTESPGAMALAAAANGVSLTERMSRVLAEELTALGINWNYAPALDMAYNSGNPAVGTRSFGADPSKVGEMGAAAVRGFQSGGVAACAKHFPGLGNTAVDTHLALPTLDTPLEQLLIRDMQPFRAAIQAEIASIMTTHTIYATLDDTLPVTLSPVIIRRLVREDLHFDGIVTSDCMEMKAIADHYAPGETAVLAALAGVDIILFSHTPSMQEAAFQSLLEAAQSGRVPIEVIETANRRIDSMKAAYPHHPPDPSLIRLPSHVQLALEAARAGVVVLKDSALLPVADNSTLVEFASQLDSGILESGGVTGFSTYLREYIPRLQTVVVPPENADSAVLQKIENTVEKSEMLILATRNAHLNPDQLETAWRLMKQVKRVVLVCLRNPYDGEVLSAADTIVCTCGDSDPSLRAAAEVLAGKFKPSGRLPVPVNLHSSFERA